MTSESEDADELVDYSMRCDGRHGSPAGHRSAQQLAGHVGTWRLIAEKELLLRGGGAGERVRGKQKRRQRTYNCLLETYSFLTEHARTQTYISKKRLTLVGKYSHAASEVALLRTPLKNRGEGQR